MKLQVLGACALVAVACLLANASAMAAAPSPAVANACGKLLPASRLAALTGGTFTSLYARVLPADNISLCGFAGTAGSEANAFPVDVDHPDVAMHVIAGTTPAAKKALARDWALYSHPAASGRYSCTSTVPGAVQRDPRDCLVQPLAGFGDRAAEFNDYIVVQKGSVLFQIWAGNNGPHHLSYDQLEVVAKYLLAKIK